MSEENEIDSFADLGLASWVVRTTKNLGNLEIPLPGY